MGKEGIEIASDQARLGLFVTYLRKLISFRIGPLRPLHLANMNTSGIILAFSHLHILLRVPLTVHSAFPNDASMSHVLSYVTLNCVYLICRDF